MIFPAGARQRRRHFRIGERPASASAPPSTQRQRITNGEGKSVTWNPRLVNTPVPIIFATTMQVAVVSVTDGTARRLGIGLVTPGSMKSGLSGKVGRTAGLLMGLQYA